MIAVLTLHGAGCSCGPCPVWLEIKTVAEGLGGADVVGLGWGSAENFVIFFFLRFVCFLFACPRSPWLLMGSL